YAGLPSNNFFTLYDVQGLVAGSEVYGGALGAAGNSSRAEKLLGDNPITESPVPPDSGSISNISTYWTAAYPGGNVTAAGMMGVDLGTFSFVSHNALGTSMLAFTGASQKLENFPGLVANNTGQVAGPGG